MLSALAFKITLLYPLQLKRKCFNSKNIVVVTQNLIINQPSPSFLSCITISEVVKEPTKAEGQKVTPEDDGEWVRRHLQLSLRKHALHVWSWEMRLHCITPFHLLSPLLRQVSW